MKHQSMRATATLNLIAICLSMTVSICAVLGQDGTTTVIQGVVQTEGGEPIRNARIDISTATPVSGPALFCPSCYLDCQKWTTTDDLGRFKIADLDSQLKFRLVISAAGYKTAQTGLLEPQEKSHDLTLLARPKTIDMSRTVQGFVRNETGIAVQGALVSPVYTIDRKGLRSSSTKGVSPSVTDSKGYFEIDLVDGVSAIDVEISAAGLCNKRLLDLKPGGDLTTLELLEGASIGGTIHSKGRPVAGMTVSVAQTDRVDRGEKFFQKAIPTVTDSQGRFELKNLLPNQEYCVYSVRGEADRSNSASILKTQKFVTPSSGEYLGIGRLTVVQPVSIGGRLVRSDGEPIPKLALRLNRDPAWDLIKVPVASDGSFRIDGLPPEVYEIDLASSDFDLDADKIDCLLWTERSVKKLIEKTIDDFELPIRQIERKNSRSERTETQVLTGRVILAGEVGVSGLVVSANDGNEPKAITADDGTFMLEIPATAAWLKLYRPDKDGMRFWYLGRVKPKFEGDAFTIQLGPETTSQIETVSKTQK